MNVDMPGYGSESSPDDEYEWCSCSKLRRRVGSTQICQWCECEEEVTVNRTFDGADDYLTSWHNHAK